MPDFSYAGGPKFNPYEMPALYGAMPIQDTMSKYYDLEKQRLAHEASLDAEADEQRMEEAARQAYDPATGDVNLAPVMQALWETGNYKEALDLYNAMNRREEDVLKSVPLGSDLIRVGRDGKIEVLRPGRQKPTKGPAYKEETWFDPNTNEFTSFDAYAPDAIIRRMEARNRGWVQGKPRTPGGGFEGMPGAEKYPFMQGTPKARRVELGTEQKAAPTTTETQSPKTGLPKSKPKQGGQASSQKQAENQKVHVLRLK